MGRSTTGRPSSPALSEAEIDIAGALAPEVGDGEFRQPAAAEINDALAEVSSSGEDDEAFIAAHQASSNRKSTAVNANNSSKKGGGFQSMGLNPALLKAISRKGFSVPTPIQRKTIPLILDNQDVVGMARTGSGKTAAFVIPMLQNLKSHSVKVGARAIILSPSRELALQTLKSIKEFGKSSDLRCVLLVGGDSLEDQFAHMSDNPDVIIATPGRFLHLLVEMSLDLSSVGYVVFDEADRLFEMGFASQLTEILHALPPSRQTLLFSATLPSNLVAFAQAGLREPVLVRLDAESKISPDLESAFFAVKSSEKEGALLHVLNDIIKMPLGNIIESSSSNTAQSGVSRKRKRETQKPNAQDLPTAHSTIVFAATKHHVEYLTALLRHQGFPVSFVYGSLDQTARREQVESFRAGKTTVLVVTDVAARGIDIPMLANVINYDFPSQPKVFVHRVGRTARAGRRGWSYSLVQNSDIPYLLDLQLFLGRKLVVGRNGGISASFAQDIVLGRVPNSKLEPQQELVTSQAEGDDDISGLKNVALKGEKLYTRTRNAASLESVRRAKSLNAQSSFQEANLLYEEDESNAINRDDMLARISAFRPSETVFEIGRKGLAPSDAAKAAGKMRARRESVKKKQQQQQQESTFEPEPTSADASLKIDDVEMDTSDSSGVSDEELEVTYTNDNNTNTNNAKKDSWKDEANFMSYEPTQTSLAEERGFGVHSGATQASHSNFMENAQSATMDLGVDESRSFAEPSRPKQRWDKRSKKYVSTANDQDGSKGAKMIRGESGQKIAASFRSGRFDAWRKANKLQRLPKTGEQESSRGVAKRKGGQAGKFKHYAERAPKLPDKYRDDYYKKYKKLQAAKANGMEHPGQARPKDELRGVDDVRKQRRLKQKRKEKNARPSRKKKTV